MSAYDPAVFDEAYYTRTLIGGDPAGFSYDSPKQQEQLGYKWSEAEMLGFRPVNAFFVGCATGFEVRYWQARGIDSFGVDASQWAIEHADPAIADRVALYREGPLPWPTRPAMPDDAFDAMFAFDALTLVPKEARKPLVDEMVRATSKGILIRTLVQDDPDDRRPVSGVDGVPYHKDTIDWWRSAFCRSGKFRLHKLLAYDVPGYLQVVMAFLRR